MKGWQVQPTRKYLSIATSGVVFVLGVTISAGVSPGDEVSPTTAGGTIVITNPGFEDDFVDEGCFAVFTPTGWNVFDPNGIIGGNDVVGALDPTGSTFFPAGAPEGNNAALTFVADEFEAGPLGLTQPLTDVLQEDTRYTLSVEVGNIASGIGPPPCDVSGFFDLDGFPGYRVELLAGGVVIAVDDNSLAGTIPEGEFRLTTVVANIGSAHPQLGQTLEIRLINMNMIDTPADPGIEVDFDDVRLVAEPLGDPVPANGGWGVVLAAIFCCIAGAVMIERRCLNSLV